MNRRIINSILRKKHNAWMESIEDEEVRKLVADNTVITGGAIASMLLKEPVSDFDVYFTDLETVESVAKYYVKKFNSVHNSEAHVRTDGERVRIHIRSAGVVGENTNQGEYQYFESQPLEQGEEYVEQSVEEVLEDADEVSGDSLDDDKKSKYRPVFLTDNAVTLSGKIQLVIRFYGDADKIHENYDFVHCMNYWTSKTGKCEFRSGSLESLITKQLVYVGSKYPLCSIIRLRKFIRRGWHINAGQMLKIMMQVSDLDLKDISVLEDQLTGVDSAYFIQLIDALRKKQEEDESFEISQTYVASLVDRIFG